MDKLIVISVVRDFAMYEQCIAKNAHLAGAQLVALDNREKNEAIPVLYNRLLDGYDYSKPAWFVFCHEDFQPLEPITTLLEKADKGSLWGPVGARTVWRWGFDPHYQFLGRLEQCEKDGSGLFTYGKPAPMGERVETFDCQCMVVHSSLIAAKGLRFDGQFAFDLYVEDFCVSASERHGVTSRILPLACRHWSRGVLGDRYREAERRFAEKWPEGCYTGTSTEILGGGANGYRRLMLRLKLFKRRLGASASIRGMAWLFAGKFLIKAVQFAFSIVLARLLCPSDFGIVGMVSVFAALCGIFADCGFSAALVRKLDRDERDCSTVFWFKLSIAVAAYALMFVAAPLIASFFQEPRLVSITRVVMLGMVFSSGASVMLVRLQIGLRFSMMSLVSTAAIFLSGIVGIVCACCKLGAWAVVWQGFSWHVFTLLLAFAATRWLPKAGFSMQACRGFFDFGWKHLFRGLVDVAYNNGYAVVVGKCFGAADLGLFNRADYYTSEIGGMVGGAVNDANYPILSQLQDDRAGFEKAYRRLRIIVAAVMVPAMTVLATFAEPIIRLLIGEQWLGCVPYLRILAIGAAVAPLLGLTYLPMYAKGRTDLALKLEIVIKSIGFTLLVVSIKFGILAICIAKSASTLISLAINTLAVKGLLRKC